ncbi:hypothetical protein [Paramaledivibacter caminithermalis]|uniref:hypothetical protein n=1 Tax=Paramaledivibacter caminithermalis TaxID=191027 RepID=UPI001F618DE7|nr:hypothetical protein [Paramaledivibacter caminithermalis]
MFRTKKDDSLCPCKHPKYFSNKKNRGCTKYIDIDSDYRAYINRDSIFKKKSMLSELNLKDITLDGKI